MTPFERVFKLRDRTLLFQISILTFNFVHKYLKIPVTETSEPVIFYTPTKSHKLMQIDKVLPFRIPKSVLPTLFENNCYKFWCSSEQKILSLSLCAGFNFDLSTCWTKHVLRRLLHLTNIKHFRSDTRSFFPVLIPRCQHQYDLYPPPPPHTHRGNMAWWNCCLLSSFEKRCLCTCVCVCVCVCVCASGVFTGDFISSIIKPPGGFTRQFLSKYWPLGQQKEYDEQLKAVVTHGNGSLFLMLFWLDHHYNTQRFTFAV